MTYNIDSHIKSVEDVKAFFHHLVDERKVNFHPDDNFADYINYEDKTTTFAEYEVIVYNRLIDESFTMCSNEGVDIYGIGLGELQASFGLKMA